MIARDEVADAYCRGAVMAYQDAAEFAHKLAENLPQELKFIQPTMRELANTFKNKANNADAIYQAAVNGDLDEAIRGVRE